MMPAASSDGKARMALRLAFDNQTMLRATRLALVVGPILVLINQGDTLVSGGSPDWLKVVLTYAVPYCVSTWTSVSKDLDSRFINPDPSERSE